MTLEEAEGNLRPKQREAISNAVECADGPEYVDDLAFVSRLLTELMFLHEQTPIEWCLVIARRAFLKMAQNEGVIPRPPRIVHHGPSKWDQLAGECARYRDNAAALDQALVEERRKHDRETFQLRQEIAELRESYAELRLRLEAG